MLVRQGSHVWGVLWELDTTHSDTLDQQEGVPTVYNKKTVNVQLEDGTSQVSETVFVRPVTVATILTFLREGFI